MAKLNKPFLNLDANEKIVWVGSPSQYVNIPIYIFCGLTFFLIIPLIYAFWLWLETEFTNFQITTDRILMRRGFLWRRLDDLELFRVKDISLIEPILLRLMRLSNIELITSDTTSPQLSIQGVEDGVQLREKLRKLILHARQKRGVREIDYYHEKALPR